MPASQPAEIVGLVPRRALIEAAAALLRCENFSGERVLEDRIEALVPERGFEDVLDQISSPSSPMGGGSAAALTGALAAALGCMVARISKVEAAHFLAHREFFAQACRARRGSFSSACLRRAGTTSPASAATAAATFPPELTEQAKELDRDLLRLKEQAAAKLHSDITTALALASACRAGGIAAARANLPFIEDAAFRKEIEEQLDRRPV